MNILAVLGSPKTNGNTEAIMNEYLKGIQENSNSFLIKIVNVAKMKISPCVACEKCSSHGARCVIQDDMQNLYDEIIKADAIILSSPIYWWHLTAQIKLFIDRFYGLDYSFFENKKIIFLSTHGGGEEDSGVQIAEKSIKDMCKFLNMKFIYRFSVESSKLEGIQRNITLDKAYNLGKKLQYSM